MRLNRLNWRLAVSLIFFLIAVVTVGILQYIMLGPHLRYGFADVDWTFLYRFKSLPSFSINQLIDEWKGSGVYAYQTYYIGIQEMIFSHDYEKFHLTTNIFRFLSVVTLYPMVFYLSKDRLLAVVTTIIYGVSYTAIGAMYTVVTSGIYISLTILNLFFLFYIFCIRRVNNRWWWIVILFVLFFSSLFLSTERLYPLFPLIILIEFFLMWRVGFKRVSVVDSAKRLLLVGVPLGLGLLYKPYAATNVQFLGNTQILLERIVDGNWQLLLTPFISLGGMLVPREYWNYFGVVSDVDLIRYMRFYISNFVITFGMITLLLAFATSSRPKLFLFRTLILTFTLAFISYFLINHRLGIPEVTRTNFDPQIYFIPALIGQYLFALGYAYFEEWRSQNFKEILPFCAFFGILSAFLFIVLTWLPAEPGLMFTSVHRYLTVPGVGMSLFLGSVMMLTFYKLKSFKFLHYFAPVVFLLLVPLIMVNDQVTRNYFKYEIDFAGTNGYEHNRMKSKLWSYLGDIDTKKPALFYFDESLGKDDGYFHETTLLAGFHFWMVLWNGENPQAVVMPELMRSSLLCPGVQVPCLEGVEKYVEVRDGQKGVVFNKTFYPPKSIYAFGLVNRDVVDIRSEFLNKMSLE